MTYHVCVIGHLEARHDRAMALRDAVDPAAWISWDPGTLGCKGNHLNAYKHLMHLDRDWCVVLEDDAILCDGFNRQLEQALDVAPTPVVSLYLGTGHPRHRQPDIKRAQNAARAANACWITAGTMLHTVGVAIRTELVYDMLRAVSSPKAPIDQSMTAWLRHHKLQVAYTVPSLVDHNDDIPSIEDHRRTAHQPRRAWRFGIRTQWDATSVHISQGKPSP